MRILKSVMLASVAIGFAFAAIPASAADRAAGSQGSGESAREAPGGAVISERGNPIEPLKLDEEGVPRALELDQGKIEHSYGTVVRKRDGSESREPASESMKQLLSGDEEGAMREGIDPALPDENTRQVFGKDDRIQITDTKGFPYKTFGLLQGKNSKGVLFNCSATLIGARTVLTAAHCLYNHETGWLDDFVFAPGITSMKDIPYGIYKHEAAYVFQGFIDNYEGYYGSVVPWDIAVVVLEKPAGDDLGWMAYGYDEDLDSFVANIVGYPGDMPSGTMWAASCDVSKESLEDMYFQFLCDTYPGSSGSSVYRYLKDEDERTIFGVNVAESPVSNTAVRINKLYFDWLKDHVK